MFWYVLYSTYTLCIRYFIITLCIFCSTFKTNKEETEGSSYQRKFAHKSTANGLAMVCCNTCNQWCHCICMGLTKRKADKLPPWTCPMCLKYTIAACSFGFFVLMMFIAHLIMHNNYLDCVGI